MNEQHTDTAIAIWVAQSIVGNPIIRNLFTNEADELDVASVALMGTETHFTFGNGQQAVVAINPKKVGPPFGHGPGIRGAQDI